MMLIQRRLNVDATSWRCIDVEPTLYKRHVPAGKYSCFNDIFSDISSYARNRNTALWWPFYA